MTYAPSNYTSTQAATDDIHHTLQTTPHSIHQHKTLRSRYINNNNNNPQQHTKNARIQQLYHPTINNIHRPLCPTRTTLRRRHLTTTTSTENYRQRTSPDPGHAAPTQHMHDVYIHLHLV